MATSCSFIDLEKNFPELVAKIVGYTGVAVWNVAEIEGESAFALTLLVETESGFEWKEISDCDKVGGTKKSAELCSIDGGKK